MTTRPLDQLSPESRAVLSLVLLQSRSYSDIADLLRLEEREVRNRAHIAAEQLVAPTEEIGPQTVARVIDYMLGEQAVSERAATRTELARSEPARRWATELAAALAPLAKTPLPTIPGGTPHPPPDTPDPPRDTPDPPGAVVDPAPPEPAPRPEPPPSPAAPGPRRFATTSADRPSAGPSPDRAPTRRWPRLPPIALLIGGLVAVVAIVVLVIALSGSSTPRPFAATGHPGQSLRKLVLAPAGSNRSALGAGDVIRQKSGGLLLLLQAHGLRANGHHDSYAVWLFNSPSDARLLGFVSPGVGAAGTFSSGVTLPDDAVRFHALIVTLEQTSQPTTPGPTVLRAPLSLG